VSRVTSRPQHVVVEHSFDELQPHLICVQNCASGRHDAPEPLGSTQQVADASHWLALQTGPGPRSGTGAAQPASTSLPSTLPPSIAPSVSLVPPPSAPPSPAGGTSSSGPRQMRFSRQTRPSLHVPFG